MSGLFTTNERGEFTCGGLIAGLEHLRSVKQTLGAEKRRDDRQIATFIPEAGQTLDLGTFRDK